jgi:hypothetical protein
MRPTGLFVKSFAFSLKKHYKERITSFDNILLGSRNTKLEKLRMILFDVYLRQLLECKNKKTK